MYTANTRVFFPFPTVQCIFEKITDITCCPFYNIIHPWNDLGRPYVLFPSTKHFMSNIWRDSC